MITQAEIEAYREKVQDAFETLSIAYNHFKKVDLWVAEDPIFKDLKTALSDVGTFRAGKVRDYSELFVGFRVDDVYADEFKITYDEISFRTKMEIALESIASAQNYFTATVEESRYYVWSRAEGDIYDTFSTIEDAQKYLEECEEEDMCNGVYIEGHYEIYDSLKEEIVARKVQDFNEIRTTKRVSASGGALKISITSECNALGVGVGDYIEVTIRRASRRN